MISKDAISSNDRGAELYNKRNFDEALRYFEKAVALAPDYGKAWCNRANCLFSLKRHQEAVNSYRRAVDVSPLFPEAWLSKANAELSLGLSDNAVISYQIFLVLADQQNHKSLMQSAAQSLKDLSSKGFRTKDTETYLWLVKGCRAAIEQRQCDKAIKHFDSAISLFPQCAVAWHFKALCMREMNRPDEAIECWKKAVVADHYNATYWFNLGVLYAKQRVFDAALSSYTSATELDPFYMEAWNNKGRVLGMLRRVDEAVECFNRAIELYPASAVTWFNKALLEDAAGRREDAAISYSRFVEHALDFPDIYEEQLKHAGKRLDEMMPAVPLMSDAPTGHAEAGTEDVTVEHKTTPSAAQVSDEAASRSDKAFDCLSAGDFDGAIRYADQALALNNRDEIAWINKGAALYNKAWINHETYKYDGEMMNTALSCFNMAIGINPRYPSGFLNKGLCLNDLMQYREAIACFDKTIELDPMNATAWCHKGNSFRGMGLYKEALSCCDRAIELAPLFPFRIISRLSRLKA